jgi:hypothetical protein
MDIDHYRPKATCLAKQGDEAHAAGNPDEARAHWQEALEILNLGAIELEDEHIAMLRLRDRVAKALAGAVAA